MGKRAKKTKKPAKKSYTRIVGPLLAVLAMALYLGVIWFYITQSYKSQPLQTGSLSSGQTFVGEDFSKSLDLRIAAKAKYPSSAIKETKDEGTGGGVKEQVISFGVPTDNLTEYALMTTPDGTPPPQGWPTIILCHGYYNPQQYQTTTGYVDDMDFYSQHGFAVIKPDFRGQGLSIDSGSPEGAYYSMAYNTDVMSLISAVKDTSYLDKADISLWGHSMGAYIALRAAVLSPDIKNVILLSGPVGDPQHMFSDYSAISDRDNPVALKLRESVLLKYGTPITNPKFWNTTAPLHYLSQLKADVQINVGSMDRVVPPIFSAELDTALIQADKPHQYYVYDDGDHGLIPQRPQILSHSLDVLSPDSAAGQI